MGHFFPNKKKPSSQNHVHFILQQTNRKLQTMTTTAENNKQHQLIDQLLCIFNDNDKNQNMVNNISMPKS